MDDMPRGGMGMMPPEVLMLLPMIEALALAVGFVVFAYLVVTLDRKRDNSPSKDDTQVGIKLVLYGLTLAGIMVAAGGLNGLLSYVLGGFKGGAGPIKGAIPPILVGGGTAFAMMMMMLPRTNVKTAPQAERYAVGVLASVFGAMAIGAASAFLTGLFNSFPWQMTSGSLSSLIVDGGIGFVALGRLGGLSGWSTPVRPAAPMSPPGYPPQQGGGYPPQQGGGYPPQGGGYPPQQGGGYPPQGGGYPPQGGGGYPPR
jgi:hypothetical protein